MFSSSLSRSSCRAQGCCSSLDIGRFATYYVTANVGNTTPNQSGCHCFPRCHFLCHIPTQISEAATESEVSQFILQSHRAFHREFFNDVLGQAELTTMSENMNDGGVTMDDIFVYKNSMVRSEERQRTSALVPLWEYEALATPGFIEGNMLKRLEAFSREHQMLEEATNRCELFFVMNFML